MKENQFFQGAVSSAEELSLRTLLHEESCEGQVGRTLLACYNPSQPQLPQLCEEGTPMKAYVFINVAPGKSNDVAGRLRATKGVFADICWGRHSLRT